MREICSYCRERVAKGAMARHYKTCRIYRRRLKKNNFVKTEEPEEIAEKVGLENEDAIPVLQSTEAIEPESPQAGVSPVIESEPPTNEENEAKTEEIEEEIAETSTAPLPEIVQNEIYTEDELQGMKYNALKVLASAKAKEWNKTISSAPSKVELIDFILKGNE